MSSITSLSALQLTSLITDYLGSKNKEIEDSIENIFIKELPYTSIRTIKKVKTLTFKIIKNKYVQMVHTSDSYFHNKYIIAINDGQKLIDNSYCPFKGGINISATNLAVLIKVHKFYTKEVLLTPKVKQRLLDFIIKGFPDPEFCCFDFSKFLCGKYSINHLYRPFGLDWKMSSFPEEGQLKPGDFVSLCVRDKEFPELNGFIAKHHAFCLGDGLYLSVNGSGGHFVVMDLEGMAKWWKTDHVFLITPIE